MPWVLGSRAAPSPEPDAEHDALAALDRGSPAEALAVLMRAYGTAVYRYCRRMVADDDLAQEVHQMTFIKAYESLERFGRRSSLRTWLFGIARHRCLDLLKMDRRRRNRFDPLDEAPDLSGPAASAEDLLTERARNRLLADCLGSLAPRARDTLLLRFQQGLSYPEMALLTDEKAPALQIRVTRALPLLRRCLEEKGVATP
jgi:RNA polymerase sigma factor (sigma-70 family)